MINRSRGMRKVKGGRNAETHHLSFRPKAERPKRRNLSVWCVVRIESGRPDKTDRFLDCARNDKFLYFDRV